jgi:hypothetical protein
MWVGLNAGGWGPEQYGDVKRAVEYVRLDTPSDISEWTNAGLKVIADRSGPYTTAGVKALNISEWVSKAVTYVTANPATVAVEVLNEPGNPAFWGADAESAENRSAYARLLKAVHAAFAANFGSAAPLILASFDGGDGHASWGEGLYAADPNVGTYVDGFTIHSYSGTGPLGSRERIERAHAYTGEPVYVTEFGWDSSQVSEAEQATDIYSFVVWARSTGYIAAVLDFGYRDYTNSAPDMWGVETHEGRKKPAYAALRDAAAGLPLGL